MSESSGCMRNFIIALVICVVLVGGGCVATGYWVYNKSFEWAASFVDMGVTTALEESSLTEEEKTGIKASVKKLTDRIRNKEVEMVQFQNQSQAFMSGKVYAQFMLIEFQRRHLAKSGLSDSEKAAGQRTVQRVSRGINDKIFKYRQDLEPVMPVEVQTYESEDGGQPIEYTIIKKILTDEDVRVVLEKFKALADKNSIADEAFEIDIVKEIDDAIEELIKKK